MASVTYGKSIMANETEPRRVEKKRQIDKQTDQTNKKDLTNVSMNGIIKSCQIFIC